jgi:hypothetical protein
VHRVEGWEEGCEVSTQLLKFGGLGHTLSLWAREEEVVEAFMLQKPASRILVNGPSSQGAVGFSSHLMPSFSLGCGPQAGNITSDNITAKHLINLKRAARLRRDWEEIDQSSHERARSLGGEDAPRGSGLRGDPALGGARGGESVHVTPAPAVVQKTTSSKSPATKSPSAKPARAVKGTRPTLHLRESRAALPSFTRPTGSGSSTAVMTRPAPTVQAATEPSSKAAHVGAALNASEIQSIMSQAGSGCPLGPCNGCPHHEVTTGACKA